VKQYNLSLLLITLCVPSLFSMETGLDIPIQKLAPMLLEAQNKHAHNFTQKMLDNIQNNPDKLNQLMEQAVNLYENNGDNLAINLAKKLDNTSLSNEWVTKLEKQIADQTNATFKKNFEQQFDTIKKSLADSIANIQKSKTIKTPSSQENWIITFNQVNDAVSKNYSQIIQHTMTNQDQVLIGHVGDKNDAINSIYKQFAKNPQAKLIDIQQTPQGSVDILLAPYTLHAQMEDIFKTSQDLLSQPDASVTKHPLFTYFDKLNENGVFVATLCSGPTIQDFTNLILGKHNLNLSPQGNFDSPSLKIFNNVETFLRCLDIFKKYYYQATGKTIVSDVSFNLSTIPLDTFCAKYVAEYPELISMPSNDQEKFIRLLSVFSIGNNILDLNITLKMSIQNKPDQHVSFKPIEITFESSKENISNEISLGQQNLYKQIQNLSGSELSMPYIKDADGVAQLAALQPVLRREHLNFVELGGGRGETNAVLKAVKDAGSDINLLNVEPHQPFAQPYIQAHQIVGIPNVHVMQKTAQSVTVDDILNHFNGKKADVLFASHAFYFLLGDLYKASQNPSLPLNQHPFWKFCNMVRDDGVIVITLQTGAGARLFRNALLGNHGLNKPANAADETTSLLSSFGNMATLLRSLEDFAQRYKEETGKTLLIKMHCGVANVPLGDFIINKDQDTQGFMIHNPQGEDADTHWLAPKMMDFYGNWKEQQLLATLTPEKAAEMSADDAQKLGIMDKSDPTNPHVSEDMIKQKRDTAIKTQSTFLHILPAFAPGRVNMQHPNITLEITIQQ